MNLLYNVQRYNNQYQLRIPLSSTIDNIEDLEDPSNYAIGDENKARLRDKYLISRFTYNNEHGLLLKFATGFNKI